MENLDQSKLLDPLDNLIAGYANYYARYFQGESELHQKLAEGQSPKILVIACCDSRVDPALITKAKEGDLFIVRNVANIVPPYESDHARHGVSAAIEFAVCHLNVQHVIVKGHSGCGGILALLKGIQGQDQFISRWVSVLEPAKKKVLEKFKSEISHEVCRACEHEGIKTSLANLRTFPFIHKKINEGKLALHGWYFDLSDGCLLKLEEASGKFVDIFQ